MMRRLALLVLGLCIFASQLLAQNRTITGKVSDEKGSPLVGVTVTVRGDNKFRTQTDVSGSFSISAPATATALVFSYVGYTGQTVTISGNTLSVSLKPEASEMEVIVTGYTTTAKSKYAGAASAVTKDKINFVPNASFDQILQGRAPGLLVTVGSGQPGAAARVQIRGQSSISGGSGPLYVLDGMPLEDGVFQSLNPNDFEDVQVLRDGTVTALYGNRGGSGVIMITSKKGKAGKPVISYTGQAGITQPGKQNFEMMNTAELFQFQEVLGQKNVANLPGWTLSQKNPTYINGTAAQKASIDRQRDSMLAINTDWKDVFMRNGTFQSHDLNISGGSGPARFYVAAGYYDEDGIGLRSDLTRYTLRANLDIKTERLTASFNHSAGFTKRNFIESENSVTLANPFAAAYLGLPYQRLINPITNFYDTGAGKTGPNAYARIDGTTSFNDQYKVNVAYRANYDITKNVYIGGFAGLDFRQTVGERSVFPGSYAANTSGFPVGPAATPGYGRGSFAKSYSNFFQYVLRANAGFKKVFAEKHDVNLQGIVEYTDEKGSGFGYTGYGIDPKRLNTPAAITAGTVDNRLIAAVNGSKTARRLFGGIATLNYTYDGKYTLDASFRRDASTQLAPDVRWDNFYGAGLSWNVLKEKFAGNWNLFNDLRVRASYGVTANADGFYFGDFGNRPLFGTGQYAGVYTTNVPTNAGNLEVTWEKIKTYNVGFDFGLLKNRISGTLDFYHKTTVDNIIPQRVSAVGGFGVGASIPVNSGTVVNKGVELLLNGDIIRGKDFTWSAGGNIAYNRNEVTSLGQVSEFEQGTELVKVGMPLGTHYITKWAGVDAATGSPLYYTLDGKITTNYSDNYRQSTFGTYNAPWIGGFNTTLRYKGISLSAFFTYQSGFSRFNNQDYFQLNHAFALQGFNLRKEMVNMWKNPGDVTDIQSPLTARQFVSKDIQDASYLRFRNLNLSYDLDSKVVSALKAFQGIRVYAQAQNLYTWTEWTGFDPEDNNNIAQYEYPTPRTITFGLQVTFK